MAAHIKHILLSALAGPPATIGRIYDQGGLFDAIEASARATAAGYDGKIYVVFDDHTIREFRRATKDFGPVVANPFEAV